MWGAPGVSITAVTAVHCMPRAFPCALAAATHAAVTRSMLSRHHPRATELSAPRDVCRSTATCRTATDARRHCWGCERRLAASAGGSIGVQSHSHWIIAAK